MWFFTAIFIFGLCWTDAVNNTYVAYLPKYIRPGFDISYTISLFNLKNPVTVESEFSSSDKQFQLKAVNDMQNGDSQAITLGAVPRGYSGDRKFELRIKATDKVTSEVVFNNVTDAFKYASKAFSIYIQTDKAIYQPGQTIKFRGICLNPDLRPLSGNVTYQVQDPNDNIVFLETAATLSHGVAGGEFALNKDSVPGNWKINYIVQGYKESLSVEVKFYKLPKFKVEVTAPKFFHPEMEGFLVKLKATYTFGKPVEGHARLTIKLSYPSFGFRYSVDGGPNAISKTKQEYTGNWDVYISKTELENTLGQNRANPQNLIITGFVTERFTETTFNDSVEVTGKPTNIKLETLYKPNTMKPGLTYTAYVKLSQQDGQALLPKDRIDNSLIASITYQYPRGYTFPGDTTTPVSWYTPKKDQTLVFPIPVDGTVKLSINPPTDGFTSVRFYLYTNLTEETNRWSTYWNIKRALSPSNSYMQITTSDNTVNPGDTAAFNIRTTEAVSEIEILVLSRGEIVTNTTYVTPGGIPRQDHSYSFSVTYDMVPNIQVLGSYVRSDGEIVADYVQIMVTVSLRNSVSITSSSYNVDAGNDVSIKVQTSAPGSYVGARAIDESVLLLKSGNDITQDRVLKDLNRYSVSDDHTFDDNFFIFWCWYPRPSGAKDAFEVFQKAGMIILTNALLYDAPGDDYEYYAVDAMYDVLEFPSAVNFVNGDSQSDVNIPKLRSYFPETWLWNSFVSGSDGSVTFNTTAPDTITSWVLSAFSISDRYGLGIADTAKITVFRKFFLVLNLPLKVTRGEIIIVQAVVFNYFDTALDVELTLSQSDKFELIIPGDDAKIAGPQRNLTVASDSSASISFPLRMEALGDIPITISIVSELATDAVKRTVYVRPEGIKQCYSVSSLFNRKFMNESSTEDNLEIRIPFGIVPGSTKVNLYVYGNILGNTMHNLGRLLQTPGGCGEQNMLRFAPDVFVTLYLDRAGTLDAETRTRAYKHFTDGYQIELTYKHKDGSYSAFGESDPSGSTWLTAFVAKCFIFARKLRPELVEERIINEALDFLVKQQNRGGDFREPGRVSHKAMQGGVNSPLTMTAYVLITLSENPIENETIADAIGKARNYLERYLDSIVGDAYSLAIVTYALQLTNSVRTSDALRSLDALATVENGMRFWQQESSSASSYSLRWRPPYYSPPTNDIEMTSYALMTYVRRSDLATAATITKWLTSKQNSLGGYSSTQDTVIAVQALSSMATLLIGRQQNLAITASHLQHSSFSTNFLITEANSVVFNSAEVPAVNGTLDISATGVGIGVAQLSVCYNVPMDPFDNEPFDCDAHVSTDGLDIADVEFCCRLKPDDKDTTGMFLMEIGLPNGFTADVFNEKLRNPSAQLVELSEESLNVYFDQLSPESRVCATGKLVRYADVAANKPSTLRAQQYYKPDRQVEVLYSPKAFSDSGVCGICSDCAGCPGPELGEWSPWSPCFDYCAAGDSIRERHCINPSQNKVVDISFCGLTHIPVEQKGCPVVNFPCPNYENGLWSDLMERRYRYYFRRNLIRSTCEAHGSTGRTTKIPGVALLGVNGPYISCSIHSLKDYLSDYKIKSHGFTISFLVKPNDLDSKNPETFLAFGRERHSSIFSLKKISWKKPSQLRFLMKYKQTRYVVKDIPISKISKGNWAHIVITWNENSELSSENNASNVAVYINGESVGESLKFSQKKNSSIPKRDVKFYLGKMPLGDDWRRGNFNGSFSSLMYWSKALATEQIGALNSYFREFLDFGDEEPILSVTHLRRMAPSTKKTCFNVPETLSSIYRRFGRRNSLEC